jgi:4-hydroxy-tetrahydrodipicolinate reductase
MDITIMGDGPLGRAIAATCAERSVRARVLGRPAGASSTGDGSLGARHDPADLVGSAVVIEASRGDAVASNLATALDAGCRRFVIATTAWEADRPRVARMLEANAASAVAAPNLSVGMALFGRLVDAAVALYGPVAAFDPYLVEWHRRGKADRPSGTARALAARIVEAHPRLLRAALGPAEASDPEALEVVGIRAGANPGSHLVGFDAPGETIEIRHVSRDRSAYAAGALAAADWLLAVPRAAGLHSFDVVVDDLLAGRREVAMAAR